MALVEAKCRSCGGNITLDDTRERGFCQYCGTEHILEKVINNTYITNNFAGATINVEAPDLLNYKKLISDSIDKGKYEEARRLIKEALPYSPEDENIWLLNTLVDFKELKKSVFDMCGVNKTTSSTTDLLRKHYESVQGYSEKKEIVDLFKPIQWNGIMNNFIESLSKIQSQELLDRAFVTAANTMIVVFFPLKKAREEYNPYDKGNIYVSKEEKDKIYSILESCIIPIYGYLLNIFSDSRISDSSIDKILGVLIEQYVQMEKIGEGHNSLIIMPEIFTKEYFCFCNSPKPEVLVKHKRGKMESAAYLGNYMAYFINQSHPGYNSDTMEKFKSLLNEETVGCYVATCVYGSIDCAEVCALRLYRDSYLKKRWYGRVFIKLYYAISPTLVSFLGECMWFKDIIRPILDKKVKILAENGYMNTREEETLAKSAEVIKSSEYARRDLCK